MTSLFSYGQEAQEKIKGQWTFSKFQPAGIYGMTYQVAEMYLGDTLTINNMVNQSMEENEFTKKLGITRDKCQFKPTTVTQIKNIEKYFVEGYKLKPILISIDSTKKVFEIVNECKEPLYSLFIFNSSDDELWVTEGGMFFLLKRIK